ncbi:MAG: ATP-binding protein [Fimbriimonadales bacterium]|nr:ATP-binding protein [Fimbriimonadales bacterium]
MPKSAPRLRIENFGPIREAEVEFGDLTVLVGSQATGKSLFLQIYKLLTDLGGVYERFRQAGLVWATEPSVLLDLYLGEGMGGAYQAGRTRFILNDEVVDFEQSLTDAPKRRDKSERVLYIPAQRVMSIRDGLPLRFIDFRAGDPFVLREFSDKIHQMTQTEFALKQKFFPIEGRLSEPLRSRLHQSVFAGLELHLKEHQFQKRFVLTDESGREMPYLVWSAGQREFTPLLLGLYLLLPAGKVARRKGFECVVIEEPEMGLHPQAITDVMAAVLELLRRGYRVCLTSHSAFTLSIVWALRILKEYKGKPEDVLRIFELDEQSLEMAQHALRVHSKVYYFQRNGAALDISTLDPASECTVESGWGGLTASEGNIGEVIATVVSRRDYEKAS